MNEDLKDALRDTARALPLVAIALVLMVAVYMVASPVIWGAWPL